MLDQSVTRFMINTGFGHEVSREYLNHMVLGTSRLGNMWTHRKKGIPEEDNSLNLAQTLPCVFFLKLFPSCNFCSESVISCFSNFRELHKIHLTQKIGHWNLQSIAYTFRYTS